MPTIGLPQAPVVGADIGRIENGRHGVLDTAFAQDNARPRKDKAQKAGGRAMITNETAHKVAALVSVIVFSLIYLPGRCGQLGAEILIPLFALLYSVVFSALLMAFIFLSYIWSDIFQVYIWVGSPFTARKRLTQEGSLAVSALLFVVSVVLLYGFAKDWCFAI